MPGNLALTHDYLIGTMLRQVVDFVQGMRSGDDQHFRVQFLREFGDAARLEAFGDRKQDLTGPVDPRFPENLHARCIAFHGRQTCPLGEADDIGLIVDQNEVALGLAQPFGDELADAAVSDHNDVPLVGLLLRDRQFGLADPLRREAEDEGVD